MALTVFNAGCLAKWPWCEVDADDSEACCDKGDDAMLASGSEASEGCGFTGWPGQSETHPKCCAALLA